MNKAGIANRLSKAGLRNAAEAYREEVRRRLAQDQGGKERDRDQVSAAAWQEMWDAFRPTVELWEKGQQGQGDEELALFGCPEDVDAFLDPNYTEQDPGKWLRDGLIWTAAEIRRVVTDTSAGVVIDLTKAKTKPPTAWAVFCLESYARRPPAKRADLIAKVLPFATKATEDAGGTGSPEGKGEGFLGEVG